MLEYVVKFSFCLVTILFHSEKICPWLHISFKILIEVTLSLTFHLAAYNVLDFVHSVTSSVSYFTFVTDFRGRTLRMVMRNWNYIASNQEGMPWMDTKTSQRTHLGENRPSCVTIEEECPHSSITAQICLQVLRKGIVELSNINTEDIAAHLPKRSSFGSLFLYT